jgi:hypothetical protein
VTCIASCEEDPATENAVDEGTDNESHTEENDEPRIQNSKQVMQVMDNLSQFALLKNDHTVIEAVTKL